MLTRHEDARRYSAPPVEDLEKIADEEAQRADHDNQNEKDLEL